MNQEIMVKENKNYSDIVVPMFEITAQQASERIKALQQFVSTQMQEGIDYGRIPGTPKPSLFKPGAEKLTELYGFSKEVDVINRIENWEIGFFSYEVKVTLKSKRTGLLEAEGVGSCNTKEKRYRGEKQDPFTLVNTVLKMAKKRALIDAVLSATRSSSIFTQDIEDMYDKSTGEKNIAPQTFKPSQTPVKSNEFATEAQLRKIYAVSTNIGLSHEAAKNMILTRYKKESSKDLTKSEASAFIEHLTSLEEISKDMGSPTIGTAGEANV